MTLDDARIERYGRQILLAEVGGRGQERLLRSAVAVVGAGAAADVAALLLGRAGIGRLELVGAKSPTASPDCVVVRRDAPAALGDVDAAAWIGTAPPPSWRGVAVCAGLVGDAPTVLALPGRPCVRCLPASAPAPPGDALDARALGALAAAETLRLVLVPTAPARRTRLGAGGMAIDSLDGTRPCPACPCPASS